jgi:hypothetical protein
MKKKHTLLKLIMTVANDSSERGIYTKSGTTEAKFKRWNGTEWIPVALKRYNGSSWDNEVIKIYNGSTWEDKT